MEDVPVDILVVGGGPVGLTMAAELARHGVRVHIVDKSKASSYLSKVLAVISSHWLCLMVSSWRIRQMSSQSATVFRKAA